MFEGIIDLRAPTPEPEAPNFAVLGPGDETLFYVWGHSNVLPWEEVLRKAHETAEAGGFQQDITDISFWRGVLIDSRPDVYKWGRVRTRYSLDVKRMVRELLRRGIVSASTPVRIGNWAGRRGVLVGTARQIAGRPDEPSRLVLYHGTTNLHFAEGLYYEGRGVSSIKEHGLRSVPLTYRVWKDAGGKRGHPLHREEAVYLTASQDSAEYYAQKATRVLRVRGYRGVEPVVLKVHLFKRDFPGLRADDDYLDRRRYLGQPAVEEDWFGSLQEFGQVAFVGVIPPGQLEVM